MKDNKIRKKIENIYKSMGYSQKPLHPYQKFADDLMEYEGVSKYAKKINLRKSDILIIMKVITESAPYQRGNQKSMMASLNAIMPQEDTKELFEDSEELKQIFKDSEALIQTRQTHQREVEILARIIAHGCGYNEELSAGIGLNHDIGHTPFGHGGERFLTTGGMLRDCGYIVHGAMGPTTLERENIIKRAAKEIKQFNSKVKDEDISEFMRYLIDGIVSHNGEGTVGRFKPKDKDKQQMAEEIRKCFTTKGYDKELMPATMEGAIIRYADIIAYTRSDILDGFRLLDINGNKILTGFDDEYLSIIATLLARKNGFEKMLTLENKFLLEMYGLSKRIKEMSSLESKTPEQKLEIERSIKERNFIEAKYKEFEEDKIAYAKDYIEKIEPKSEVKTEVTQMMQNTFVMDLVETSKDKPEITMSPLIRRTLFALRELNARKIVPYTRRGFELQELPIAVNGLIDIFANVLIDTGIAYQTIPKEVQKKLPSIKSKEEHDKKRNEFDKTKKSTYDKKIYHYYEKIKPEDLDFMYGNVLEAMEDITKYDIAIAVGEEKYNGPLKEVYETTKINSIKEKIRNMGKTSETMIDEDKQKLFQTLLEEKKNNVEKAIASKMAIEYIAPMAEKTLLTVLLSKNLITKKQLVEGYGRSVPGTQAIDPCVKNLQASFKDESTIYPDDKEDYEISL